MNTCKRGFVPYALAYHAVGMYCEQATERARETASTLARVKYISMMHLASEKAGCR